MAIENKNKGIQNVMDKINNNKGLLSDKVNEDEQVYIMGQHIQKSKKGNIYVGGVDIDKGPSQGDVIHGANKYKTKDGYVEDFDFTYRPSTRKSSQGDNVKHWTITGVAR